MSNLPADDPFTTTPDVGRTGGLLYNQLRLDPSSNGRTTSIPHSSPAQVKRTLQARLEDIQKRIHEAGQLGESLIRQQQELVDRLAEVEAEAVNGGEINPELRKRLADLEKEYNEVHKESARALLSSKIHGGLESPHKSPHSSTFQSLGTGSPTKLTVPNSRRARNQPTRSHDIEFAADLAQNLIVELRKLNATVQERDETIKLITEEKLNLERHAAMLESKIKALDESERKCKESNWALELLVQELTARENERAESDGKLSAQLAVMEQEKNYHIKVNEELKQKHAKEDDDHEATIRHHEGEIVGLKRNLVTAETERDSLKKEVEDLRQELEEAHNASSKLKHLNDELMAQKQQSQDPFHGSQNDDQTPEHSPPPSPTKPTPRHGPLEAETLRSSLQHAHRLITNLKNNVHREKTEKSELKRLLAEARDELEQVRKEGSAPTSAKKPKRDALSDIKYKKPARPNLLGATRKPKNEITLLDNDLDSPDWEDHTPYTLSSVPQSPTPMGGLGGRGNLNRQSTESSFGDAFESAFESAQETDGAFETANEKDYVEEPKTPLKDYPTSADEMTETEGTSTIGKRSIYSGMGSFKGSLTLQKPRDRGSIYSIGSEDDDDGLFKHNAIPTLDPNAFQPREEFSPAQASQRFKLRIRSGRGRLGQRIPSDGSMFATARAQSIESSPNQSFPPTAAQSPATSIRPRGSISSVQARGASKSLFAELGGSFGTMTGSFTEDDEQTVDDEERTPIKSGFGSPLRLMVDEGCNTEEPYPELQEVTPVLPRPATPPPRPDMVESGTQSSPVRRVTFAEVGTQKTPVQKPILSESSTQSTPLPRAILFDSGTQSTPIAYSEAGMQSDEIPKPVMVATAVQSDAVPKTPKPVMVTAGVQSTPRVYAESSVQSDEIPKPVMVATGVDAIPKTPKPAMVATGVDALPRTPKPVMVQAQTQFTPVRPKVYAESSVQSDDVPKPAMVIAGTQSTPKVYAERSVQLTPKLPMISSGMQFEGLPNMVQIPTIPIETARKYTSTGSQPEPIEKILSSIGIQHDEPAKKVATISFGVQSDEIARPSMVSFGVQSEVETKPKMSDAETQSDEEPVREIVQISTGTQFDPKLEGIEVEKLVAISVQGIVKPEMVDMGSQFDPMLEGLRGQQMEIGDAAAVPLPDPVEKVDTATQFDPELEGVPVLLPELSTGSTQTDVEEEAPQILSIAVAEVAKQEPMEASTPALSIVVSEIAKQEPIEVTTPPLSIVVSEVAKQEPAEEAIPALSIVLSEVVSQEPVDAPERIGFSAIACQDIVPVEPEHKTPRALPPIPAPIPMLAEAGLSSDEETPKKVSESLELTRERPSTPTPEQSEKSSFLGPLFRKGKTDALESEITAQDKGKQVDRRPFMVDQGVQTAITYESTIRPVLVGTSLAGNNNAPYNSSATVVVHPPRTSSMQGIQTIGRITGRVADNIPTGVKRPSSSNSNRSFTALYPPLPEDHREAIAAAQQSGAGLIESTSVMGPPMLPASATRNTSFRPRTPVANNGTIRLVDESPTTSKGGSTPRPRMSQTTMRSDVVSPPSHRSSISSFASELDDRFRINDHKSHVPPQMQNDPKIIQAITQTMIGEYLWKYTRTATKGSLSSNRHRRFFWIHPYTRTLYWGEHDPSTGGKQEMKAKSVSIEAVRVITDDNPLPPGLHRKSLVVVTPGRTIQFTAPTGQRHETWYMALSYLLTQRMGDGVGNGTAGAVTAGEESEHEQDDADFAPPYNGPRAQSSLSSYNSRGTRNASPVRNASSLSHRRPPPQTNPNYGSISRLSNMFGTFTTKSSRHTSMSATSMYDDSMANDSIEDMRLEMERQEREADRMEYVRACCDGKHDVGTLTRKSASRTIRGKHHHHTHTHAHTAYAQPPPQPQYAQHYHSDSVEDRES